MDMHCTISGIMMMSSIENSINTFYTKLKDSLASLVLLLLCALFLLVVEYVFFLSRSTNVAACQLWRRLFVTRWQQLREKPEHGKELESTVCG